MSAHITYILLSVHSLTYFLLFNYIHLSNHDTILFAEEFLPF
jgi:hypothetical protein